MNCDVTLRELKATIYIYIKEETTKIQLYNFEHMTRITVSREKQQELEKKIGRANLKKVNAEI